MKHLTRATVIAVMLAMPANAQTSDTTTGARTAPLIVNDRAVFVFRSALGANEPDERAAVATARIQAALVADDTGRVTARPIQEGMLIAYGNRGLFTVTPRDVDGAQGETLEMLTAATVRQLGAAIEAERTRGSAWRIARAIALVILATLLFLAFGRALSSGWRQASVRTQRWSAARVRVAIGGFTLLPPSQVVSALRRLVDFTAWGLGLFAAYVWLTFVLTRFRLSRAWGETLGSYLITTVRDLTLGGLAAIPGLFTVVLIFFATRFITRLVKTLFEAIETGEVAVPWAHADTAQPTRRLIVALLWLFALVVAYPYLPGSESNVFKGVSVFAGLVLSLGSSGIVNQAMSGLVLMYSRAMRSGDYVRVGEVEGTVTDVGMLSTKIRTNKLEEITIPNAVLVSNTTKNYSRLAAEQGVILYTSVTIGYDAPWRQVHALLEMAASRTPGLRDDPPPFVRQTALSDHYAEYQLNAYLERPEDRIAVLSDLHAHIQDCFNEYGVQIMSPHYEADPPVPKVVPKEGWAPKPSPGATHPPATGFNEGISAAVLPP